MRIVISFRKTRNERRERRVRKIRRLNFEVSRWPLAGESSLFEWSTDESRIEDEALDELFKKVGGTSGHLFRKKKLLLYESCVFRVSLKGHNF